MSKGLYMRAAWALIRATRSLSAEQRYQAFAAAGRIALRVGPFSSPMRHKKSGALKHLFFESGLPIVLRVRVSGLAAAYAAQREHGALLLCSAHFPLDMVVRPVLDADGHRLSAITAGRPEQLGIFGSDRVVERIDPGKNAFLKARRRLAQGNIVLTAQDVRGLPRGAPRLRTLELTRGFALRPDVFYFAHTVKSAIACYASRLAPDGVIELDIGALRPPPQSEAEALAAAQAAATYFHAYARHLEDRTPRGVPWPQRP